MAELKKLFIIFIFLMISQFAVSAEIVNFKFHLNSEIRSLDPAQVSFGYGVGYFFQNIYRGLYIYRDSKLTPLGAKSCKQKELKITCELKNPDFKWSDGKTVEAKDYVLAFRHLLGVKSKSSIISILKNLKNATRVFSGSLRPEDLGIKALSSRTLEFTFESIDPEFLYKLTSPLVAPLRSESFPDEEHASELLVTGPYQIEKWDRTKEVLLKENPLYIHFKKGKPKVEIFFIDDDQTALNLYEAHKLNFLKTLPTAQVPEYKSRADYFEFPMTRFDYVGFAPALRDQAKLREALSKSLDFLELQKMFFSKGAIGCTGLPDEMLNEKVCAKYDLVAAKKAFALVAPKVREKVFKLAFPSYDRDDVSRAMQWMAEQWKNHIGLKVEIQKMESGVFTASLKDSPPDIFRKSAIVDRPSCLAAIENFSQKGSESFLKINSSHLETVLQKMQKLKPDQQKSLCTEAVRDLIDNYDLIGMGQQHFTILMSPRFKGWQLSDLNTLDLSQLAYDPSGPEL